MNKLFFVANWKSNKTVKDAGSWLDIFKQNINKINMENKTVVIAPSFTTLVFCSEYIKNNNLPISIASQNISKFSSGAYTGEVNANQVKEFCQYSIIGHSERRRNFFETDEDVKEKVGLAKKENITTIVCVQNEQAVVPQDADMVAYEPIFAIGSGNPDNPENVGSVFSKISSTTGKDVLLYGGSVDPENIASFLNVPLLSGFLIGSSSLDPEVFISLLSKC